MQELLPRSTNVASAQTTHLDEIHGSASVTINRMLVVTVLMPRSQDDIHRCISATKSRKLRVAAMEWPCNRDIYRTILALHVILTLFILEDK